jgi:glycerol uptake facilitator-like aquaporin
MVRQDGRVTSAPDLPRRLVSEFLGSAFLAAIVIGSGIAAQRLSPSDTGLQLLENSAATAAGLFAVILMFGPVSGAHFNPVVSFADAALGGLRWRDAAAYLAAQVAGCVTGAVVANLMFARAAVSISVKHRASGAHALSEVIATAGLLLVIFALARSGRAAAAPAAVGVQFFGHKDAEVAKRIDIAATAIFHGMSVDEVSDLDLSYTPPLGSPWDAVQMDAQAWTRYAGRP